MDDKLNQVIIQAVLHRPIFSRIAALSSDEKEEVKKKVKDKLKGKDKAKDKEKEKDEKGKKFNPFVKKDVEKATPEETSEEIPNETPEGGDDKSPEDMIAELQGELDAIAEDGKVSPAEILGLVDNIMSMMNLVLHAKLPKEATIASRVANSHMADKMAAKGIQRHRKDKDTMDDTGGSSKGRSREPDQKPSREDHRKSPKRKVEKDPDNDNDPDKKASLDEALSLFGI